MSNYENMECITLCKQYKFHIEDANFSKGFIPKKILLDRTRNIHSYLVFCKIENNSLLSEYWSGSNFTSAFKSILATQYSDLDRPLFFLFRDNNSMLKSIEGAEIRYAILKNPKLNIYNYILEHSICFNEVAFRLKREL